MELSRDLPKNWIVRGFLYFFLSDILVTLPRPQLTTGRVFLLIYMLRKSFTDAEWPASERWAKMLEKYKCCFVLYCFVCLIVSYCIVYVSCTGYCMFHIVYCIAFYIIYDIVYWTLLLVPYRVKFYFMVSSLLERLAGRRSLSCRCTVLQWKWNTGP